MTGEAEMARVKPMLDATRTGPAAEKLRQGLRRLIVGQDEAVQQIVNVYQVFLAGMNNTDRPIGSLLFLGPTGSGKTRIVEATAEVLLGNPRSVVKIDCSEFQHSHEIAKLIGSPPGYLGHRETHPLLSQEALDQHHTESARLGFVLFDEIEKASDALWNLLLGILDKATLTLGDNRRVDFSRTMVFLTSNLGARQMDSLLRPNLGFAVAGGGRGMEAELARGPLSGKIERAGVEAARRRFTPEFMNRLDKIVVFRPLGKPELERVLDIELRLLQQRIFESAGASFFVFTTSAAARELMLAQGADLRFGARHLRRALDRLLVQPLANLAASGQIRDGDAVYVDHDPPREALSFRRQAEGIAFEEMAEMAGVRLDAPAVAAAGAVVEALRTGSARSSRRG